jgi:outer membrane protein
VANAYVGVLRSLEGVAVVQSHVKSLASHTKTVQDMLDQGFVASNDLLASNVALANARQLALQARNRLDIACAAYNRLLCRPLDRKVSLEKLTLSPPAQALEILTARALKQRSELRLLSMNISALQHKAAMEKAVYGPQIGITGGYGYEENRYMAHEGIWSAQIGLKWNFDGGIAWHRSASIKKEAEALQENHSDVKTIIALETRRAWLTLGESRERVKVTHKALAQGEENLKVTEDQYKQGLTTNTTVLEAESLRTRSHSNYVNASYDVEMAILRLRHAIGEM